LEHEPDGELGAGDHPLGFLPGEDYRELGWPLDAVDVLEPRQFHLEDVPVQKENRAEGLVLSGGGHITLVGKVGEECLDLRRPHLTGVPFAVVKDEPADPVAVGVLGPAAVVLGPNEAPDFVQKLGLPAMAGGDTFSCMRRKYSQASLATQGNRL
jgi:hypothetical protein